MDDDKKTPIDETLERFAQRLSRRHEQISDSDVKRLETIQESAIKAYDKQRAVMELDQNLGALVMIMTYLEKVPDKIFLEQMRQAHLKKNDWSVSAERIRTFFKKKIRLWRRLVATMDSQGRN